MKTRAILAAACVLLFAMPGAQAQNTLFSSPELDFFTQNMLGKEFGMPPNEASRTRLLDGGKVESAFDRKIRYSNLAVSPEGFSFNVLFTIKQTLYDLDANGNRILPGRSMDRTFVSRHEFGRNISTGKIVGNRKTIYNDSPNANFGMTSNLILSMEGDKLVILTLPGGFTDHFAAGGQYKPGTSETRTEFVVKDGTITRTTITQTFDVDPATLRITPVGEKTVTVDVAEVGGR